jgi:hypothetical protein
VKFQPHELPVARGGKSLRYPFRKDAIYVFLGEFPNLPGHCVVAESKNGKIHAGYHTESFIELTSGEI